VTDLPPRGAPVLARNDAACNRWMHDRRRERRRPLRVPLWNASRSASDRTRDARLRAHMRACRSVPAAACQSVVHASRWPACAFVRDRSASLACAITPDAGVRSAPARSSSSEDASRSAHFAFDPAGSRHSLVPPRGTSGRGRTADREPCALAFFTNPITGAGADRRWRTDGDGLYRLSRTVRVATCVCSRGGQREC
jgi:hypothetical protein